MPEQRSSEGGFREALDSLIHRGAAPRAPVAPGAEPAEPMPAEPVAPEPVAGGSEPSPSEPAPAGAALAEGVEAAEPAPVEPGSAERAEPVPAEAAEPEPAEPAPAEPVAAEAEPTPSPWVRVVPMPAPDRAAHRGSGLTRAPLPPGTADETTGLYHRVVWQAVLAAEEARWARYREPCLLVQLQISGIEAVARRLGEPVAEQVLAALADILREETRESDSYARVSRWRIQGLLVDRASSGAAAYEARVRERFARRLEGLPFGLRVGTAAPGPRLGFAAALAVAEERMHGEPLAGPAELHVRSSSPAAEAARSAPGTGSPAAENGVARAGAPEPTAAPARFEPGSLRAAFIALEELHADRLVSEDEYDRKRIELLDRL